MRFSCLPLPKTYRFLIVWRMPPPHTQKMRLRCAIQEGYKHRHVLVKGVGVPRLQEPRRQTEWRCFHICWLNTRAGWDGNGSKGGSEVPLSYPSLPIGNLHVNRSLLNLCAQSELLDCLGLETDLLSFLYKFSFTDFMWLHQFIPVKDLNCSFQVWLFKIKCF